MKNYEKAQELLDKIPDLIEKRKIGGKDLPTEVFIKKKRTCCRLSSRTWSSEDRIAVAFYKEKQIAMTGSEDGFARAASISPAEGAYIVTNHAEIC